VQKNKDMRNSSKRSLIRPFRDMTGYHVPRTHRHETIIRRVFLTTADWRCDKLARTSGYQYQADECLQRAE